jgi:Ca-activated chloride channel family protein
MELASPHLIGLAIIALVPYLLTRGRALPYAHHTLLGARRGRHLLAWMPDGLFIAAALLLGMALARPQGEGETQQTHMQGRDVILTLDLSSSMTFPMPTAHGSSVERLRAAKSAALEFIDQLPGDRMGLIVFGAEAFGVWPLSSDLALVKRKIEGIRGPIPPAFDGTEIEKALLKSLAHFEELGQAREKILIMLTDGLDTIPAEQAREIVAKIRRLGVKFYLIGIGLSPHSDVVRLTQMVDGRRFDVMQPAHMTQAFAEISALERSSIVVETAFTRQEIFPIFAAASMFCFVLALVNRRYFRLLPCRPRDPSKPVNSSSPV